LYVELGLISLFKMDEFFRLIDTHPWVTSHRAQDIQFAAWGTRLEITVARDEEEISNMKECKNIC